MSATESPIPKLTFVLGGTRSGKSEFAEKTAESFGSHILYIATAENIPGEGSMNERILRHQTRRPSSWQTLECPRSIASTLRMTGIAQGFDGVMVDCITMLTSNILFSLPSSRNMTDFEQALQQEIDELVAFISQSPIPWIIVSSETGLGIIPENCETRHYCDGLGIVNRILSEAANQVHLIVAGLSIRLK